MFIVDTLKSCNNPHLVYADLEGSTIAGGYIPYHILTSPQRPYIVLYGEEQKEIMIVELTVPFETNTTDAKKRKQDRYATLISDLVCTGYRAILYI